MLTPNQKIGLAVLDYHGGQFTPTYAVGSTLIAGMMPDNETIVKAVAELRHLYGMPEHWSDRHLKITIARLEKLIA